MKRAALVGALLLLAIPAPAEAAKGRKVRVVSTEYGRTLVDAKGQALYLFTRDRRKRSRCYGDCAEAWPPFITRGRPRAGKGVRKRWLGTTRRRGGKRQVTYRGRPLYYYVDDAPGRILCQAVREFGGIWYLVSPRGRAIR
jgi:predicted lipoprotein with Yx(FWY)xxD motif